jgi:methyl-accepting chemotaxis protein
MSLLRLNISQLIAASLGAVVVLMVLIAGVTWIELSGIGRATSMAVGRTQSVLKGQELAEALLRSLALSNRYALNETDGDLAATKASVEDLKQALAGFAAVAASDGGTLEKVRAAYAAYETDINAMITAIGQRRSGGATFGTVSTAVSTTSGAIAEAMVNEGRQDGLAAAFKLVENVQAGTAAVNRYLARRDPAQANAAKYRIVRMQEAAEGLKSDAAGAARVQRFVRILEPQLADYAKAVDALIDATDASTKSSAERQKAADTLVAQIAELRGGTGAQLDAAMKGVSGSVNTSRVVMGAASILAIVVAVLAWRVLISRIVVGLSRLQQQMQRVAAGELDVEISERDRADEVGGMARALEVFKKNTQAMEAMRAETAAQEQRAAEEKRKVVTVLAADFETQVNQSVQQVKSASTQMDTASRSMATVAEQTAQEVRGANRAAEQALADVQTVSAAAEELAASISEIGRQITHSDQISKAAVARAEETSQMVARLTEAADKIGAVVQIISDIAGQTNLLALNATIEAARAGDAGKGFAVVAGEVKHLASQTGKATDEIGSQVAAIQQATHQAVAAINTIVGTINELSETSTTIAAAIEEQQAATQEISRGVQAAADGTSVVARTLGSVSATAETGGETAGEVVGQASQLNRTTGELQRAVESFLSRMRQ